MDLKGYVKLNEEDSWKKIIENKVTINHSDNSFMILFNIFKKVNLKLCVYPLKTKFRPILEIVEDDNGNVKEVRNSLEKVLFDEGSITISSDGSGRKSFGSSEKKNLDFPEILDLKEITEEEIIDESSKEGSEEFNSKSETPPRRLKRTRRRSESFDSQRSTVEKEKKQKDTSPLPEIPKPISKKIYNHNNVLLGTNFEEKSQNSESRKSSAKSSPSQAIPQCIICYSNFFILNLKLRKKLKLLDF